MLLTVVVARIMTRNIGIMAVVIMVHIMHRVAVVVMLHIRVHVRLIMSQMVRSMMAVVVRIMIPVVRRTPVSVVRTTITVEQQRTRIVHRFDDIVHAIDVRSTDDLYVRCAEPHLNHQSSHILIDVGCQHGLDKQHMVAALKGLQHAQVVDIAVVVEVEVRYHVRTGVQYHLKLLHARCLTESGGHGLQVEIETYIRGQGVNLYSSCTRRVRARVRDGRTYRLRIYHLLLSGLCHYYGLHRRRFGCHSHDSCHTAACQQYRQSQ